MNTRNVKQLKSQELSKELLKLQMMIRKIRFSSGAKEKNVKKIRELKKEIARLKTLQVFNQF